MKLILLKVLHSSEYRGHLCITTKLFKLKLYVYLMMHANIELIEIGTILSSVLNKFLLNVLRWQHH